MKTILISSSVLITVLLILRAAFRHSISRRVQYALWGLVLMRLLIPASLPPFSLSVLNLSQAAQTQVEKTLSKDLYVLPMSRSPISDYPAAYGLEPGELIPGAESSGYPVLNHDGITVTKYAHQLSLSAALRWTWYAGMAVMGLWVLVSNHRFLRKVRNGRFPYASALCKYPVYVCGGLSSPCLFGLFRPAIYLTPDVISNETSLPHVLAHEETHARHLDPLWSLLRCVCLTVYWFDPLVWAAAIISKTDCELACDESVLKRLGPEERIPYGRTLLGLVRTRPGNPLLSATTMTSGKRQLKDRITRIAENRQTVSIALLFILSAVILVAVCTFTGSKSTPAPTDHNGPVNPLVLPDSDPDAVVRLKDVTPNQPQAVTVSAADHADVALAITSNAKPILQGMVPFGKYTVLCRQDSDGTTYFTYGGTDEIRENLGAAQFYNFLTCPALHYEHDYSVQTFDLLGHDGFSITYCAGKDGEPLVPSQPAQSEYTAHRYYYFDADGTLRLLASTIGGTDTIADWDGDGVMELISPPYDNGDLPSLYFVRNGGICSVNLAAMTEQAYPGWEPYICFGSYNTETLDLPVSGYYQKDGNMADAFRYLFFTGTELRFYKDWRITADHVAGTPDVPDNVLAAAKDAVLNAFNGTKSDTLLAQAGYDDWRVERLTHAQDYTFNNTTIEVYNLNYEFHATHPEKVVLAGGAYLTEDGWHMPDYPNCHWLFFSVREGKRVLLKQEMINDGSPGTELFDSEVRSIALEAGIVSMTDLTKEELLIDFYATSFDFAERLGTLSAADKATVCEKLCYYRTSGTDEEQSLYQDTIQSMNYNANGESMGDAWKAGYSFLGYYNTPTPTATGEQRGFAVPAANAWIEQHYNQGSACLCCDVRHLDIDDAETARVVSLYTDSDLAQANGWSHEYATQMVAVLAVYDVEWDTSIPPSDESGLCARYLYLLPDKSGGNAWKVWDTMGCAVPTEYRAESST